jgi:hypothetical protein
MILTVKIQIITILDFQNDTSQSSQKIGRPLEFVDVALSFESSSQPPLNFVNKTLSTD